MVAEKMLHAHMTNTIVMPEGELVTSDEANRPLHSMLKGLSVTLAALPCEKLYVLQDGINAELQAKESYVLQVLNEQKINMEELSL